jgi:hypothetical protein
LSLLLTPCCPFIVLSACVFDGAAGGIIRAASLASGGRLSDVDESKWLRNFLKARQAACASTPSRGARCVVLTAD